MIRCRIHNNNAGFAVIIGVHVFIDRRNLICFFQRKIRIGCRIVQLGISFYVKDGAECFQSVRRFFYFFKLFAFLIISGKYSGNVVDRLAPLDLVYNIVTFRVYGSKIISVH